MQSPIVCYSLFNIWIVVFRLFLHYVGAWLKHILIFDVKNYVWAHILLNAEIAIICQFLLKVSASRINSCIRSLYIVKFPLCYHTACWNQQGIFHSGVKTLIHLGWPWPFLHKDNLPHGNTWWWPWVIGLAVIGLVKMSILNSINLFNLHSNVEINAVECPQVRSSP